MLLLWLMARRGRLADGQQFELFLGLEFMAIFPLLKWGLPNSAKNFCNSLPLAMDSNHIKPNMPKPIRICYDFASNLCSIKATMATAVPA